MAMGRIQYLSQTLNRITEFSFVLNNELRPEDTAGNPCYDRPAKNLYLLHGLTGIDTDWVWGGGNANYVARQFNLNVFMPTCGNNFYLDRPGDGNAYGTFVGQEFVDYTQKLFHLSAKREDNLIGGLSMGGFGTLNTVFAYPERFFAAIALSSPNPTDPQHPEGLDNPLLRYNRAFHEEIFGTDPRLAESDKNPKVRAQQAIDAGKPLPRLYVACGTEDELIYVSRDFRDFFAPRLRSFRFEEGPGAHEWRFWSDYLVRALTWIFQ